MVVASLLALGVSETSSSSNSAASGSVAAAGTCASALAAGELGASPTASAPSDAVKLAHSSERSISCSLARVDPATSAGEAVAADPAGTSCSAGAAGTENSAGAEAVGREVVWGWAAASFFVRRARSTLKATTQFAKTFSIYCVAALRVNLLKLRCQFGGSPVIPCAQVQIEQTLERGSVFRYSLQHIIEQLDGFLRQPIARKQVHISERLANETLHFIIEPEVVRTALQARPVRRRRGRVGGSGSCGKMSSRSAGASEG